MPVTIPEPYAEAHELRRATVDVETNGAAGPATHCRVKAKWVESPFDRLQPDVRKIAIGISESDRPGDLTAIGRDLCRESDRCDCRL